MSSIKIKVYPGATSLYWRGMRPLKIWEQRFSGSVEDEVDRNSNMYVDRY